jgi:conjugative transposon TraN protein
MEIFDFISLFNLLFIIKTKVMKRIVSFIFVSLTFIFVNAQQPVHSLNLEITTNKTTFLLFPFQILHVDRGTQDILIEQVNPAKNVLLVKAAIPNFQSTNLTIITEDGAVYPFAVRYDSLPACTVFRFPMLSINPTYSAIGKQMNLQELEFYSKMVLNKRRTVGGIKEHKWEMQVSVKGIFIKDDVIFYQLCLQNNSAINFTPDFIRFYIRDKKKSKRTASQEIEMKPIYTYGNVNTIPGEHERNGVFAFEKFTIPEAKYLFVEVMEKNGGRNLTLKIGNNKIIKAKVLPEIESN